MSETVTPIGRYAVETCTDRNEWNAFLRRNDGPLYDHWGWRNAVSSYGLDNWPLLARDRDTGNVAALLPLYYLDSQLLGSQLLSPAFAERGGIVVNSGTDATEPAELLLSHTMQMATDLDVDFVSLRGAQTDTSTEFTVKNRYVTFHVPVNRDLDTVWSGLKDSRQRQVTQAGDDDSLRYEVGTSLDHLKSYYRLYLRTMRRHGSPPHSFEFFRILWDELSGEEKFHLGLIFHEGDPINGIIDLSLGSTVYQWGVVNDYDYRSLNGGSYLLWKSLKRAAENAYHTYEMGRTREGSGVYLFKKSFGGKKVWYDDLHYFPGAKANLPNPDDGTYDRLREVWKRLPLTITRTLGPYIRKNLGI